MVYCTHLTTFDNKTPKKQNEYYSKEPFDSVVFQTEAQDSHRVLSKWCRHSAPVPVSSGWQANIESFLFEARNLVKNNGHIHSLTCRFVKDSFLIHRLRVNDVKYQVMSQIHNYAIKPTKRLFIYVSELLNRMSSACLIARLTANFRILPWTGWMLLTLTLSLSTWRPGLERIWTVSWPQMKRPPPGHLVSCVRRA